MMGRLDFLSKNNSEEQSALLGIKAAFLSHLCSQQGTRFSTQCEFGTARYYQLLIQLYFL